MRYHLPRHNRLAALAALAAITIPCASAEPTAIGRYNDWSVFTESSGGETVCYAATTAATSRA